jgi:predicted RNase H-like HicB family nuclease
MRTATHIQEEIKEIVARPYTRELIRNSDGTWFARIVEFPGCMTEGATKEAALTELDDAMNAWLEAKLEDRDPIPEPLTAESFSGKFVVRIAKSLHRDLSRRADHEGVSLNQFVTTSLARAVAC